MKVKFTKDFGKYGEFENNLLSSNQIVDIGSSGLEVYAFKRGRGVCRDGRDLRLLAGDFIGVVYVVVSDRRWRR